MTLWLPLRKGEVVLDGIVEVLTQNENKQYWEALPRVRQLRFLSYKSGDPIRSLNILHADYEKLDKKFHNKKIPLGESYCGYRLIPNRIYFYTLSQNDFSEVNQYVLDDEVWYEELISL